MQLASSSLKDTAAPARVTDSSLTIALIVVARNAEKHLATLLASLEAQTYPKDLVEVILVDSCSTDSTARLFASFREQGWRRVQRFRNEDKSLAVGWNLAIRHSSSGASVRLDAHAVPPADFLEFLARRLEEGENIVGGVVQCAGGESWSSRLILSLETSALGAAAAAFRRPGPSRYVDTVAYAAYRREVFEAVGLFVPSLCRDQDNEFHSRCRKAGFRFLLDPGVSVVYHPRDSLWSYVVQKTSNGFWLSRALYHSLGSCRPRHLAPGALLAVLLPLTILKWPAALTLVLMHAALVFLSLGTPGARLALGSRFNAAVLGVLIHIAYGAGTISGFLSLPVYAAGVRLKRNGGGQDSSAANAANTRLF